jgi:hypothetical protein
MFGGEIGVLWAWTRHLEVAGGWRYRDWTHDDGPASFNGPFVRLGASF